MPACRPAIVLTGPTVEGAIAALPLVLLLGTLLLLLLLLRGVLRAGRTLQSKVCRPPVLLATCSTLGWSGLMHMDRGLPPDTANVCATTFRSRSTKTAARPAAAATNAPHEPGTKQQALEASPA